MAKINKRERFTLIELERDHVAIMVADSDLIIIIALKSGISFNLKNSDIEEILSTYPTMDCGDTLTLSNDLEVEYHEDMAKITDLNTNNYIILTVADYGVILGKIQPTNDTLAGDCPEEAENGSKAELTNRKTSTSAVYDNVIQNIGKE